MVFGVILLKAEQAPLIVGTNAEFPPFTFLANEEIVGFDIDISKEVAKRLSREIKFKDVPFDALLPDLFLGNVDFVAAGMSVTEERAKRVLFTKPYLKDDPLVILTKKNCECLEGKNVVVVEGFTADLLMTDSLGSFLTRLPTQADCFMALKCGRADAFVTAKSTMETFFQSQGRTDFYWFALPGTGETCALVLPKQSTTLLEAIQEALDSMEADGTVAIIKKKWKLQ